MKIAVDAMGGDYAPKEIVEGALQALNEFDDIHITLVGLEEEIRPFITIDSNRLNIKHTSEVIDTDEEPVRAVRRKKDSSLVTVARMVKEKEADACISAGNTGAYMTAGLLVTGRIKGVDRPALTTIMPTTKHKPTLVLDVGANMDAKAEHLLQYAKMGHLYSKLILGNEQPTIGLLSVGTEDSKGNELVKETFPLIKQTSLNFIGNIEARDIPFGVADVVICDGFTGNVVLKLTEGVAGAIFDMLKTEFTRDLKSKLAAAVLKPGLKSFKKKMDYTEYGGAPLLGLDGVCIKAHGSSNANAIKNAIKQARHFIVHDIVNEIRSEIQKESDEK